MIVWEVTGVEDTGFVSGVWNEKYEILKTTAKHINTICFFLKTYIISPYIIYEILQKIWLIYSVESYVILW